MEISGICLVKKRNDVLRLFRHRKEIEMSITLNPDKACDFGPRVHILQSIFIHHSPSRSSAEEDGVFTLPRCRLISKSCSNSASPEVTAVLSKHSGSVLLKRLASVTTCANFPARANKHANRTLRQNNILKRNCAQSDLQCEESTEIKSFSPAGNFIKPDTKACTKLINCFHHVKTRIYHL